MTAAFRLGYACNWDRRPEATWSYTPWRLREALRRRIEVVDVGLRVPEPARAVLKLAFARRHGGRWTSTWKHTAVADRICQYAIDRGVARSDCQAVLEIQDLAVPSVPFFILQDLTFDILLRVAAENDGRVPHFPGLSPDAIRRRRDRQRRIYDRAAGVMVMSRWAASTLVDWSGVAAQKVHVVYPGRSVGAGSVPAPRVDGPSRSRLLFVGKDFHTKGGDVVLAALEILRRTHDPDLTLTVAGPATWPVPGDIPAGVTFLGRIPVDAVAQLYANHDLLVMPSRLEGFGIVFVEALAHGLPCVGRTAFAMPEIVIPGQNGGLVSDDDPAELAEVVAAVLADDHIYVTCSEQAPQVAARFTWDASAEQVLRAIRSTLD